VTKSLTKGERTRLRLLEAAERIFGEHGFHSASVTDITREAEVANGTFYLYFPSKADLLCELVRTRGHEMRAQLRLATEGMTDRAEAEQAGMLAFLDWVRSHPHIYRIVKNAEFVDGDVFQEWYRRLGEGYAEALGRSMDGGEIEPAHAEALAYCLMAVYDFAGMRWVLWEDREEIPDDVLATITGFVLRGLGIEEGRRASRA